MKKINLRTPYQLEFNRSIFVLLFLTVIIGISGLLIGTTPIDFKNLINLFSFNASDNFVLTLRFNRIVIAFCCGGMLAAGSTILQSVTKNSMVAPDLSGMTSLGCLLIILSGIFYLSSPILNVLLGIIGSMLGFFLCFLLTGRYKNNRFTMVLIGISISFFASALMQLLILRSPLNIDAYLRFLAGSLYATNRELIYIIPLITFVTIPLALILSKRLVVFALDEFTASGMGMHLRQYRSLCFLIASVLIGSSIVGIGNMGFLGIVIPNLIRLALGNRPQFVLPLSFLLGGLLYLIADIIGRCVISPAEIPAGLITNMISAPLFLYILFHYSRGQNEWN